MKRKYFETTMLPKFSILQKYILAQFFITFILCLFASTSLFLVFDLFERMRVFAKEGSTVFQAVSYLAFKIPSIVQLMTPVSVLVSTLISVGRLMQHSEITAMRACGASLFFLAKPLIYSGLAISFIMLIAGETVVPWATRVSNEVYYLDIKKKAEKGSYSREDFWHRSDNEFFNIGFYDSRLHAISNLSLFRFDNNFDLTKRIDAETVIWQGPATGWLMNGVVEIEFENNEKVDIMNFKQLPLVINEKPVDFYKSKKKPETMSYSELKEYTGKLQSEGVDVTPYLVDMAGENFFSICEPHCCTHCFPFRTQTHSLRHYDRKFSNGCDDRV